MSQRQEEVASTITPRQRGVSYGKLEKPSQDRAKPDDPGFLEQLPEILSYENTLFSARDNAGAQPNRELVKELI